MPHYLRQAPQAAYHANSLRPGPLGQPFSVVGQPGHTEQMNYSVVHAVRHIRSGLPG